MDFENILLSSATLAPEVLLTPEGVKREWAIRFEGKKITGIGPAFEFPEAIPLPGRAIIPGMVDAHTHVGQIFGKALIGGEPAQIWRRTATVSAPFLRSLLSPSTSTLSPLVSVSSSPSTFSAAIASSRRWS